MVKIILSTLLYVLDRDHLQAIIYLYSVAGRRVHHSHLAVCLDFWASLELSLLVSHLSYTAIDTCEPEDDGSFLVCL
jgi:hypothetical protein